VSRVVHDERGTASVEWRDAPGDHDRPALRVEGSGVRAPDGLAIRDDDTFNPYDRTPDSSGKPGAGGKRDLRKLSAWLKMMRELEERKKRGED
jgi:hypothetical protein